MQQPISNKFHATLTERPAFHTGLFVFFFFIYIVDDVYVFRSVTVFILEYLYLYSAGRFLVIVNIILLRLGMGVKC
jgi:hypothetical protein